MIDDDEQLWRSFASVQSLNCGCVEFTFQGVPQVAAVPGSRRVKLQ
jgi:hypothetical protein